MNTVTIHSTYLSTYWDHRFHFFPQTFFLNRYLSLPFKLTSQTNLQPRSWSWFHNCLCKPISSLKARLERDAGLFLLRLRQPSEDLPSVLFIWPLSWLIVLTLPSVFLFSLQIDGNILKAGSMCILFPPCVQHKSEYMLHDPCASLRDRILSERATFFMWMPAELFCGCWLI